jgi:hypothetical protein
MRWLYHPEHGGKVFQDKELNAMRASGWYDSPKEFPQQSLDLPVTVTVPVEPAPVKPNTVPVVSEPEPEKRSKLRRFVGRK